MKPFINYFCFICVGLMLVGFGRFDEPDNGLEDFLDDNPQLKIVDEHLANTPYEKGESIFRGRGNAPKLSYCVLHEGKLLPIKRSSMKHYKYSLTHEFADQLYTCDDTDTKIINKLTRDDFIQVMYYLNEKYKLYLKRK